MRRFTSIQAGDEKVKVPGITSDMLTTIAAEWGCSKATAVEVVIAERYGAMFPLAQEADDSSLEIVADCGRCGEPITAAEPEIYWDGERICQSCRDIALAAQGE